MTTLYEITREVESILARLAEAEERAEGEVTDETIALEAEWLRVDGERQDKLGAYLVVADREDAEGARKRERARQLTEEARRHESRAEKLRRAVQLEMEATGERKATFGDYACRIQAGRPKVEIGADFIPWAESTGRRELLRVKPPEPDKRAISDAIKAGQIVTGARIVAGEPVLVIPRAKKDTKEEVSE